jgi:hypothetical protein
VKSSRTQSQPATKAHPGADSDRYRRAALASAEDGYFVFPLHPGKKIPAIRRWQQMATQDPSLIEHWWRSGCRNIGIAAGPSRILVLDLDVSRGGQPPPRWADAHDGHDVLTRMAVIAERTIPATRTVATPSGGQHLYFRAPLKPALRNTAGQLGWCIDTRGVGGYVVGPGSSLPIGRYELVRALPVAELPEWLLTALAPAQPQPAVSPAAEFAVPRNRAAYVGAIVAAECRAVTEAPIGKRHHTLLRASRNLGRLVGGRALVASTARQALVEAAHGYVGVENYTAHQVECDVADGLAYGAQLPRFLDGQA